MAYSFECCTYYTWYICISFLLSHISYLTSISFGSTLLICGNFSQNLKKSKPHNNQLQTTHRNIWIYTLAWSGVNWADLMAAQGAFRTDFYDRSTRMIVGTMIWTEYYRPVIKIGPKGALGSHEIRPIHSAPSLGQSIVLYHCSIWGYYGSIVNFPSSLGVLLCDPCPNFDTLLCSIGLECVKKMRSNV